MAQLLAVRAWPFVGGGHPVIPKLGDLCVSASDGCASFSTGGGVSHCGAGARPPSWIFQKPPRLLSWGKICGPEDYPEGVDALLGRHMFTQKPLGE